MKKLVLLNHSWKDRRWNNRWLELHDSSPIPTLRYYLEDGEKEPINTISADQISDIVDVRDALSSRLDCSSASTFPSILDIISNDSEDLDFCVLINTKSEGLDRGREYIFRMASAGDLQSLVPVLQRVVKSLKASSESTSLIWRLQSRLRTIYEGAIFQLFVAVMIFANFGANIAQTQLNPQDGSSSASVLYAIDMTLTILFTVELIINFISSNVRPFLRDG